jgi:hypothetical protein
MLSTNTNGPQSPCQNAESASITSSHAALGNRQSQSLYTTTRVAGVDGTITQGGGSFV